MQMVYNMEVKEIIKYCEKKNICEKAHKDMKREATIKNFCKLFFENTDWALRNNIPTKEMLAIPEVSRYGLFNKDYEGQALEKMAFFGDVKAKVVARNYDVVEIYIRDNVQLHLTTEDNAKVFVTIIDNAKLKTEIKGRSKISIFNH